VLLTPFVSIILEASHMTESLRRSGMREVQQKSSIREPVSIRTGIEGFADGMSMFPRLKEWENQIALQALRERKTVDNLRGITPFRQYLGVAKRAEEAGEASPFSSFATLFAHSPSIDMLVSFGNFHTIRTWTRTFAQQYPKFHLPLEQFYQDALYRIVPYQARDYDPSFGRSFTRFVTGMLEKRFHTFAVNHIQEITTPISYEQKPTLKRGRPAQSRERAFLASLEDPEPKSGTPISLSEHLENTLFIAEDTTARDDLEARHKIHTLSRLAGLNNTQEETLVALYVYGGNTRLLSQLRRTTSRSVRGQKQTALERIQELGYETVNDILTGEYSTLDAARASHQQVSEIQ
jgi:hypothetical protein